MSQIWTENLRIETLGNDHYWKRVIFTSELLQIALMNIPPEKEIGWEIHNDTDQFFYVEKGNAIIQSKKSKKSRKVFEKSLKRGYAAEAPLGVWHNVVNPSKTVDLRLYTIYAPPHLSKRFQIKN